MSEGYIIREARKDDCSHIFAMIRELAVFEKMEDQVLTDVATLEKDGFTDGVEPSFRALIVETTDQKQVIGYALYYYVYSTWNGRIMYLEDLYVRESCRKGGIATALLKKIGEISVASGCRQCRLVCLKWNQNAMNLYVKMGAKNFTTIEEWQMLRFDEEEIKQMNA